MLGNGPLLLALSLFTAQLVRWIVWSGLVLLTLSLLLLMRTRWGQGQPLRKCVVLSVVVHLLLAIYMTTIKIVTAVGPPGDGGRPVNVALLDATSDQEFNDSTVLEPWATAASDASVPNEPGVALPNVDLPGVELPQRVEAKTPYVAEPNLPRAADENVPLPSALDEVVTARAPAAKLATPIEAPSASRATDAAEPSVSAPMAPQAPESATAELQRSTTNAASEDPLKHVDIPPPDVEPPAPMSDATQNATGARPSPGPTALSNANAGTQPASSFPLGDGASTHGTGPGGGAGADDAVNPRLVPVPPIDVARPVPSIYQGRVSADREQIAEGNGGSQQTEDAVNAALKYLAVHQLKDGRWDPNTTDAGRDAMIEGQRRTDAGKHAETGICGLAVLTYLAAGHTHVRGDYQETVRRALEFLLRNQASDGNLAGQATTYEKMYCHGIATFALSEAYAMTGDKRLEAAVRRAIAFTVSSQHPTTGGWRYLHWRSRPSDPGDTSQLGWQLMALKSAELAGIPMPDQTREGAAKFLKSVAAGNSGGLASYQPGHRTSRTMTAEALVCRQFLGTSRENPANDEAARYLLEELPGASQGNVYYWYYATLGLYQVQGDVWNRWNNALQQTLLTNQRTSGDVAGSWDPDPLWGNYGGRVYSTTLSTLCLEVYYRFLPTYVGAAPTDRRAK